MRLAGLSIPHRGKQCGNKRVKGRFIECHQSSVKAIRLYDNRNELHMPKDGLNLGVSSGIFSKPAHKVNGCLPGFVIGKLLELQQ